MLARSIISFATKLHKNEITFDKYGTKERGTKAMHRSKSTVARGINTKFEILLMIETSLKTKATTGNVKKDDAILIENIP